MKHLRLAPTALILALTACGGGGSSTPSTPTTYTALCSNGTTMTSTTSQAAAQALCPVVPASVPIVTSIPATTYAAGSQEKLAFDYLNNARSTCGFGLLAQDTLLDLSTRNHAGYMQANSITTHYEVQGNPGFTGYAPWDRATYVGYVGTTSEVALGEPSSATIPATFAVDSVRTLLAAPYHFRSMMEGWRDIGVAVKTSATQGNYLVMDPGYKSTAAKQQPTTGTVLTYPCQGTVDTARFLETETPWPIPGRTNAIGQSVLVQVAEGSTLVLNTYSITRVSGVGIDAGTVANGSVVGATSPLIKLDWSNDTNSRFTSRYNVAMLMPDKVMYPGAVYRVQVGGTVDGVLFSKDFTFTTTGKVAYDDCLAKWHTQLGYSAVSGAWTAQYLADQRALVPGYCSGASGGGLVVPTAASLARIF